MCQQRREALVWPGGKWIALQRGLSDGTGCRRKFVWYRVVLFIIQVVLTVECKFCEISNQMFSM